MDVWDYSLTGGTDPTLVTEALFERGAQRLTRVEGAELGSGTTGDRLQLRIAIEPELSDDQTHLLAVRTVSTTGDVSPLSNRVALRLGQPPPPPSDLGLLARAEGVLLSWKAPEDSPAHGYHLYRKRAEERAYAEAFHRVEPGVNEFLDSQAVFGSRYFYTVRSVASLEPLIESEAAVEAEIDYQDVFAPAPPVGLTALAEDQRVRLLIDPSPDQDVVGYVVFRREPGSDTFRRLNQDPIGELEYLDTGLAGGLTFLYRVSAVDGAGNQGEPSPPVEVTLR